MLLAALDVRADLGFGERSLEGFLDFADELLLIAARALQLALEHPVTVRIQSAKAEVLELELHGVQAQALGDRRVDLERLAGDAPPFHGRHHAERAHVVHAIRELHHDDANVAHHGEQHFAEALGLRLLAILELDLIELADAVDEIGDHLAEYRHDFRFGSRRVFDYIVQDRGDQSVGIELEVGKNVRDRDRMGDVRLARNALLTLVALGAEVVGLAHALDLRRGQIAFELI